jgi:hypothetical protein
MMMLGRSGYHAAGGGGGFSMMMLGRSGYRAAAGRGGHWRWGGRVGNGNGHHDTPDIDVCDGLTLLTLAWWVIGTSSRAVRSLGDCHGDCLGGSSRAVSRSRNWVDRGCGLHGGDRWWWLVS